MNCTATTRLTAEECLARLRDFDTAHRYRRLCRRIWGLREERRALREELSRTQTALARSNGELAGATERLGHHLYCVHHDTFNCTMVCASALLGEP